MRTVVTGGTGFIGRRLARALVDRGDDVTVIGRREAPGLADVEYRRGDVADADFVSKVWAEKEPEVVFHLASRVTGDRSLEQVLPIFEANLHSTVNVLTSSTQTGCEKVILAGSMEEPGPGDTDTVPPSPYAAAKAAGTLYARLFDALYETPVVTLRTFMVYGPGQEDRSKLVPYVTRSLLSGESPSLSSGRRLVDWVFVDDVVEAFIAAATATGVVGRIIDVGSGTQTSIRELVEMLGSMIDPSITLTFGARDERPLERSPVANADRTYEELGWRATTSLATGLERTIDWVRRSVENTSRTASGG